MNTTTNNLNPHNYTVQVTETLYGYVLTLVHAVPTVPGSHIMSYRIKQTIGFNTIENLLNTYRRMV